MAPSPHRALTALAVLSLGLLWGLARAQDSEPYSEDPPERAARLSFISGDVSLQPAGEEEWAPALVNRPLTTGDKLWTERNARAEIYVGPAAIRLDSETGFSFMNVDDDTIQMRVTAGVMNLSVRDLADREHIEIDTPNIALSLLRAGNYRVEVNDAGDATIVKVSEGSLQATGPSQDTVVYAQQAVTFTGTDNLVAQFRTLGAPDDFDSWSLERDRRDDRAETSRTAEYVSPEVTGYQDLNEYGTWSNEPEYGYVWTPSYVAAGWAPYAYGRWVSISPWGWTWIDDAPWGYAPFHYGRWAYARHRWCWVPGPRHVRPVYAPALVGWGGAYGSHVSWFPLGPREVYVPGHRYSRHYVERVNVTNTIVDRMMLANAYDHRPGGYHYRNRAVPGGVTAVSRTAFTSAGRTISNRVVFNQQDLARNDATPIAPRIAPGHEGRMGGPTRANVRVPPRNIADRQVVTRREPPPTAARYARAVVENRNTERAQERERNPDRDYRPHDRIPQQPQWRTESPAALVRERTDRPPRAERPVSETAPPTRTSVFDREALSNRVRQDRDRQVREVIQQREVQQQRENAYRERPQEQARRDNEQRQVEQRQVEQRRWQSPSEQTREIRERSQSPRMEQQLREHIQRQQEAARQAPPPRVEPRERPVQQQRSYERPQRVEQPHVERSHDQGGRSEPPKGNPERNSESRSHSRR